MYDDFMLTDTPVINYDFADGLLKLGETNDWANINSLLRGNFKCFIHYL